MHENIINFVIADLTGADSGMATATLLKHYQYYPAARRAVWQKKSHH
jgi:hypothetical protein